MVLWKKDNSKLKSTLLLLCLTGSISFNLIQSSDVDGEKRKNEKLNENLSNELDANFLLKKENDKIKKILEKRNSKIKYIKSKFKRINPKVEDDLVNLFIIVSDHYNLHPHESYDLFISQLLVESRGRQHDKKGKVITGLAGEIGVCQIIPSTALFFLKHKLSSKELESMIKLGADDPRKVKTEFQAKKWLSKTKNNVIMWGYIMNYNIKKTHGKVSEGFVAYNTGFGGLKNFKGNGHKAIEHSYYKKIKIMSSKI